MRKGNTWPRTAGTVAALLALLTACTGGGTQTPTPNGTSTPATGDTTGSQNTQPELTIKVFSMLANYAGDQPGWFAKMVKDKFNVKLNIIASNLAGGQQKIATMMAGGDLGDLVVFGSNGQDYQDAIKAGLLLDWNKDGLLQKHGQDILKHAGKAIDANKQQFGGGEKVYGIGFDVGTGTGPSEGADMTFGPDLRWDLYQKLGSPKITNIEDYLPILKKMQEMEPKSDSGKPTYGISLWSDWDGTYMTLAKVIAQLHGYQEGDGFNPGDLILVSADKPNDYQSMLDDNSYYMKGLSFYFKANQMGLLDPDSLTQKFSDVSNKMKDGQVLFSLFPWFDNVYNTPEHTSQGKGFKLVPFENEKIYAYGFSPYGGTRVWAIGAKAKDPARVMQLINWLYSPQGVMESNYGPKGLAWDLKDGKPFVTEYGWKALPANSEPVPEQYGGGTFKDGTNQINNTTLKLSNINPETGDPYDYQIWKSSLEYNTDPVTKSWREAMGVMTPKEYFVKSNKMALNTPIFTGKAPLPEPSDLKQKKSEIAKVIKSYSWKMVFAKSENEFNALKQEMQQKAKGLGYDDVVNWQLEQTKNTVWKAMSAK
ncbi:extracellular solute-binding protein [Paenibacillus chartarius]|uniref:Extracellular solute-binding protein n=1 Tax=Paenibacillus chartarius TaxID=747481 RepID=A0ABV6DL59_9BACL